MPCSIYCLLTHPEQLEDLLATLKEADVDPKYVSIVSAHSAELPPEVKRIAEFSFPFSAWLPQAVFGIYPFCTYFFWPTTLSSWQDRRLESHAWQTAGGHMVIPLKEYALEKPAARKLAGRKAR